MGSRCRYRCSIAETWIVVPETYDGVYEGCWMRVQCSYDTTVSMVS